MAIYLGTDKVSTYLKEYSVEGNYSLRPRTITPTGETFNVYPPSGEGFSLITVLGDENLKPENIRAGKTIYGVEGALNTYSAPVLYDNFVVNPSLDAQTISVPSGYDGFSSLTVTPVSSSIDQNIISSNIRSGVSILGVTGTLIEGRELNQQPLEITQNGSVDVSDYASVFVNIPSETEIPPGYILPSGRYEISTNGVYPIGEYETVKVSVPVPSGYMPVPTDSSTITVNGNYDVTQLANIVVNVRPDSTWVQPSGTKNINFNGSSIDVTSYKYVNVSVQSAKPEQTKDCVPTKSAQVIMPNSGYALSAVYVDPIPDEYINPEGTLDISVPGTHSVRNWNYVNVDVEKEIHKYVYSATQPLNATVGTIWFKPIE